VGPGVGVMVGNIWAAPTHDEKRTEVSKMSNFGIGDLAMIILVYFYLSCKMDRQTKLNGK
jgi:hypothetical protein